MNRYHCTDTGTESAIRIVGVRFFVLTYSSVHDSLWELRSFCTSSSQHPLSVHRSLGSQNLFIIPYCEDCRRWTMAWCCRLGKRVASSYLQGRQWLHTKAAEKRRRHHSEAFQGACGASFGAFSCLKHWLSWSRICRGEACQVRTLWICFHDCNNDTSISKARIVSSNADSGVLIRIIMSFSILLWCCSHIAFLSLCQN